MELRGRSVAWGLSAICTKTWRLGTVKRKGLNNILTTALELETICSGELNGAIGEGFMYSNYVFHSIIACSFFTKQCIFFAPIPIRMLEC